MDDLKAEDCSDAGRVIGIGSKTDFPGNILDQSVVVKLGVILDARPFDLNIF